MENGGGSGGAEQWHWHGRRGRLPRAVQGSGQISVWEFPRPSRLAPDTHEVRMRWGAIEVARTRRAMLVLETAHPPGFYLPCDDVAAHLLQPAGGNSRCEWKGRAHYWLLAEDHRRLANMAWSYPQPLAEAEILTDCVAFYPVGLDCIVDGAAVHPQPGCFYGGWITPERVGRFKGERGSEGW
jgi:uncharacterized protein (DUF427 family)